MAIRDFETYNALYQNLARSVEPWGGIIIALALLTPALFTMRGGCSRQLKARTALLCLGLAALALGCYYFAPNVPARIYSLYIGGALLCVYGTTAGFSQLPSASPARQSDLVALAVIGLSTALKLLYLSEWPPVLTDYAATTGVIAIENNFYEGPVSRKSIPRAYVEGGGASFLHAQLLTLLFKNFDFSIFSVRLAEVLASVGTLIFLWLWLRITVAPRWGLTGLALFTFSAEHLSQSRMGTFYSLSQCVAVGAIWLWTSILQQRGSKTARLLGLVLLNAAVLSCYRPTVTVWVFSVLLTIDCLTRYSLRGRRLSYIIFSAVTLGFFAYHALYEPFIRESFSLKKPYLASDTSIWQKTPTDEISSVIQPPLVTFSNLARNVWYVVEHAADYSPVKEDVYGILYAVSMVLGFAGLLSRRWGYISLIVVVGLLPSLTTFPLERRSLMMRPLIPLSLLLFAREWLLLSRRMIEKPTVRFSTQALCACALIALPVQGVYRLTRFNGPVGVGPSFGPEYVHEMISHLKSLPPDHSIVIMNPGFGVDKFRMAFARELYITPSTSRSIHMTTVREADNVTALPRTSFPTVYAVLNEDYRAWVVPWLLATIPNIQIYPYKQGDRVIYWLGVARSPSPR